MNFEAQDQYELAKESFLKGVEYAEKELGGSIPLAEAEEAFAEWLDSFS
jgi:hypothetical protein